MIGMRKSFVRYLVLVFIALNTEAQDLTTYLKERAVKMEKLDRLPGDVYSLMSRFQLIMIGEAHGTSEPAEFVIGLAEIMARQGDSVQVGFEIHSDAMTEFLSQYTESSIFRSAFFSTPSNDGRASIAWAGALSRLNKNSRIQIFFYDTNDWSSPNINQRDSIMYINVKNKIREKAGWKTIVICGGVHNMRLPFRGENKMGYYFSMDTELNISERMCSLHHIYQSGTMMNNRGKGLELHEINNPATEYSSGVDYENYLFLYPARFTDSHDSLMKYSEIYDGFYFTRKITASRPAKEKLQNQKK
jgi:hypothetical protein